MRTIITNGLPIPMEHGIPMYGKLIKTANKNNPFWKSYTVGYYVLNSKKVYVYFNNKNQFAIINH